MGGNWVQQKEEKGSKGREERVDSVVLKESPHRIFKRGSSESHRRLHPKHRVARRQYWTLEICSRRDEVNSFGQKRLEYGSQSCGHLEVVDPVLGPFIDAVAQFCRVPRPHEG